MDTLYIFYYNNYLNRRVIYSNNLEDYGEPIYTQENVNFKPNNEIITKQVVGRDDYDGKGDYLLVCDDEDNILSRWFIIDEERLRNGQHQLTLRNDLMVENYDDIVNSPMIIEKAMVNSVDNPFLYNNEGFSFNQIKKQEYLLKDGSLSAWYVLYFKKGLATKTISFTPYSGIEDHTISTPIAQSIFASGTKSDTTNVTPMITYSANNDWGAEAHRVAIMSNKNDWYEVAETDDYIWFNQSYRTVKSELGNALTNQYSTLKSNVLSDEGLTSQITTADREYLSWDGTLVRDSDNKLFRVHIIKNPYSVWKYKTNGNMVSTLKTLINSTSLTRTGDWGNHAFAYKYDNIEYTFSYEEETSANAFNIDIQWGTKAQTINSDYNIIAIPYNTIPFQPTQNIFGIPDGWSQALLHAIMGSYTVDSELVDIQLLPYLPIQKAATLPVGHGIVLDSSEYTFVQDSVETNKGICLLYVSNANFSFNIENVITTSNNVIDRKIQNETQMVRLCSPNYQGAFEFNVAKNGGVEYFNVDVTLKPYNPYIHINPNFKGLYGQDFDDAKGLICGGDFSIPIWSTAWQQYELNNKNYQKIFDRQIQNLDFNQSQERTLAGWNIGSGTVSGASMGALAGSKAGPYGAIAGAVVGGASSLAGGIMDYSMLKDRQAENRQFAIDNWKYQLGNIKALPYSLNKVTPLTYNNKIFPFIEIYDCTDEEKNMLRQYITYQSMTINTIGTINDFKQTNETFIKGKLIRINDAKIDYDKAEEIYNELNKGVYI